jgi:hypothetical protein
MRGTGTSDDTSPRTTEVDQTYLQSCTTGHALDPLGSHKASGRIVRLAVLVIKILPTGIILRNTPGAAVSGDRQRRHSGYRGALWHPTVRSREKYHRQKKGEFHGRLDSTWLSFASIGVHPCARESNTIDERKESLHCHLDSGSCRSGFLTLQPVSHVSGSRLSFIRTTTSSTR